MQKFGASHTGKKLDVLDHWHDFFPLALKGKYRIHYIDAFAGTGDVLIAGDDEDANQLLPGIEKQRLVLEGSATRALGAAIPYDEYTFIEKSPRKLATLKAKLAARFPHRMDSCTFVAGDANAALKRICATTNWKRTRAVIFLDPFGNHIEWATLEAIAQTEAADVWYLFPAGLGIWRQIPREGVVQPASAASMTRMMGDSSWKLLFTKSTSTPTLFGVDEVSTHRTAEVDDVIEYGIARLRTIFRGVVLDEHVKLGGSGKARWYALLFATSNPNEKAKALAKKVASWIVKHTPQ